MKKKKKKRENKERRRMRKSRRAKIKETFQDYKESNLKSIY